MIQGSVRVGLGGVRCLRLGGWTDTRIHSNNVSDTKGRDRDQTALFQHEKKKMMHLQSKAPKAAGFLKEGRRVQIYLVATPAGDETKQNKTKQNAVS